MQELLLSPEVSLLCGQRSADLDMMVLINCITHEFDPNTASSTLVPSADFDFVAGLHRGLVVIAGTHSTIVYAQKPRFAQSCQEHSDKLCTDPRDAIFALLNISKPINIISDYRKTTADVYITATRAII